MGDQLVGQRGVGDRIVDQLDDRLHLFAHLDVGDADGYAIGVDGFRGIQEQLGELLSYVQTLELGISGAEASAVTTPGGYLAPAHSNGLGYWSADLSQRLIQIVRQIGASGLIMQPTEADLASEELRPFLEKYMYGKDIAAPEKARLFRLGWELANSSFGMRQELYEYLHRGDPGAGRTRLLRQYSIADMDARVDELIALVKEKQ